MFGSTFSDIITMDDSFEDYLKRILQVNRSNLFFNFLSGPIAYVNSDVLITKIIGKSAQGKCVSSTPASKFEFLLRAFLIKKSRQVAGKQKFLKFANFLEIFNEILLFYRKFQNEVFCGHKSFHGNFAGKILKCRQMRLK